ncbi:MAG: hypothetical protein IJA75_08660 [Oscillospiraceae bacterium]|nr:hypothetical protein [Oscillospiraceae bacterium]
MDFKKMAQELVEKIQKDPQLLSKFRTDPVGVIEKLLGIDLPNDQIEKLAELVKAKIDLDKVGDLLGGLGGLFGKK